MKNRKGTEMTKLNNKSKLSETNRNYIMLGILIATLITIFVIAANFYQCSKDFAEAEVAKNEAEMEETIFEVVDYDYDLEAELEAQRQVEEQLRLEEEARIAEEQRIAAEEASKKKTQAPAKTTQSYSAPSASSGDATWFKRAGEVYQNGNRYTWYSERVLPGGGLTELNSNGRHTDENGIVRDGDGYIAVASGGHSKGTIVDTPLGTGKVYDECETPGTIDIYVGW